MRCPGQLSRLLGRHELSKENTDPYLNSSADLLKCLNESCNETAVTSLCVEKFVYRQTALSAVLLSVAWSSSSVGGRARHGWPRPAAAPLKGKASDAQLPSGTSPASRPVGAEAWTGPSICRLRVPDASESPVCAGPPGGGSPPGMLRRTVISKRGSQQGGVFVLCLITQCGLSFNDLS